MQEKDFDRLARKYLDGSATPLEQELMEAHLRLLEDMNPAELSADQLALHKLAVWQRLQAELRATEAQEPPVEKELHVIPVAKRYRFKWIAAAAVVIGIAIALWFIRPGGVDQKITATADVAAPTVNKARITLGNGKTVYLDSVANGQTIEADGIRLTKLADGRITYSGNGIASVYNTASNPRGSKVMDLQLNDHSHVWLNAGSSITYPVVFNGDSRKVTITGEAYFEVAHDAKKPFIVSKGNTSVQVLGTHFNVKAFDNDPNLKVTLLEGKVKVSSTRREQLLVPGEQAIVDNGAIALNRDVNLDDVIAWKNGFTSFHGADLVEILRELEHWYDITTEIRSNIKVTRTIDVPRDAPLKDVLKSLLEDQGIKYEYDAANRKLTVLP